MKGNAPSPMNYPAQTIRLRNGLTALIRTALPEDAEALLGLTAAVTRECPYLLYGEAEVKKLSLKSERSFLQRYLDSPHSLSLIALVGDTVAGTCSFAPPARSSFTLHRRELTILILESYSHIGLGSALLKTSMQAAEAAGATQMELEVLTGNKRAISLYEQWGFEAYGKRIRAVHRADGSWEDEWLMWKDLKNRCNNSSRL